MPKPIYVPPNLKEVISDGEEADVTITEVRVMHDVWTTIGTQKLALGVTVRHGQDDYGQMFSLDAEVLMGSIGRLLVKAGVKEINAKNAEEEAKKLIGMTVDVKNRGGKLYWYPTK